VLGPTPAHMLIFTIGFKTKSNMHACPLEMQENPSSTNHRFTSRFIRQDHEMHSKQIETGKVLCKPKVLM
jgi:hypothetical protein